uniref:Methyltransferase n=1 Tax=Rotavirus B TaxID=28876 RepID=A0A2H4ZSU1_9REOV|nr:methyltransferase [Rotavirus B]AUG44982.1 methyltransferase [Rotavirus B]AUG44984.1 methyltransferase [Rotavirus B]AUG44985.1 methyltransferase [Rotavirus B]
MSKLIEFSDLGAEISNREELFKLSNNVSSFEVIKPTKNIEDYIRSSTHYVTIDRRANDEVSQVLDTLFPTSVILNSEEGYKFGGCRHLLDNILHVSNHMRSYLNGNDQNWLPTGWSVSECDGLDDHIGDQIIRHIINTCSTQTVGQMKSLKPGTYPKLEGVDEVFREFLIKITTPQTSIDFQSYNYMLQRKQIGYVLRKTVFHLIKKNNWNVNYVGPEFESFKDIILLLTDRKYTGKFITYTLNTSKKHNHRAAEKEYNSKKAGWDFVHRYRHKFENAFCHLLFNHVMKQRSYSTIYVNTLYNVGNWTAAYSWLNINVVDHLPTIQKNSVIFGFLLSSKDCSFSVNTLSDIVVYSPQPYDDNANYWTVSIMGEMVGHLSNEELRISEKMNNLPNYVFGGVPFTAEALDLNRVTVALYSLSNAFNSPELIKATLSYNHIFTFPTYSTGNWRDERPVHDRIFVTTEKQLRFEDWVIDVKNMALEMNVEIVAESVFLQLGPHRAFITDMFQHMVSFRFKQENFFSDQKMSHFGIRQPSIHNRDRHLSSRLNAYINRQLTLTTDLTAIKKNNFAGFSGHLIAVEKYFHALVYTMSPLRWATRALSDATYKKYDNFSNAIGERHTLDDFRNTYAYLGDSVNPILKYRLINNGYADEPKYAIMLMCGNNHITLQLTTKDPSSLLNEIGNIVHGVNIKYLGRNSFGNIKLALYQTKDMLQYKLGNLLRSFDIPCQQHRPYIMHMTLKDEKCLPDVIIAHRRDIKVKEIKH